MGPPPVRARTNLAYFTARAGDAARRDLLADLLRVRELVQGDVLTTQNNLAYWPEQARSAVRTDGRTIHSGPPTDARKKTSVNVGVIPFAQGADWVAYRALS